MGGNLTGETQLPPYSGPLPSQSGGPQGMPPPVGGEAAAYYGASGSRGVPLNDGEVIVDEDDADPSFFNQARGVMRRTPSPQQFFDSASQRFNAGIAAAGSALGRIVEDPENGHYWEEVARQGEERRSREGSRSGPRGAREEARGEGGFSDHERWSEEAEEKSLERSTGAIERESERRAEEARQKSRGRAKKSVAVVVSADTNMDGKMDEEDAVYTEHAVSRPQPPS